MRAPTVALGLATAVLLFGTAMGTPRPVAAACAPGEECFPDDPSDPWWDENCEPVGEDFCCTCDDPPRTICVRVE